MPTFVHSRASALYINGVDLSTWFAKAESASTVDKADTSCFQAVYKSYVPGLTDHTLSAEAYFDGTAGAVGTQLETLLAVESSVFTVLAAGDALSNRARGFLGFQNSYRIMSDITAAVKAAIEAQSKVGPVGLIVGQPQQTYATVATSTLGVFDTALALTTAGGELHYHVFALSGTGSPSVTLNWQTSPDGSGWTTIATSGAITNTSTPSYGRVAVAPGVTMDVQSRIQVVRAGATISATVFAGVHRN